jgi:hypothetical protein
MTLRLSITQQGSGAELAVAGLTPDFKPAPGLENLAVLQKVTITCDTAGGRILAALPGGPAV